MLDAGIPTFVLSALLNQLQDAVFVIESGNFCFVNNQVTELFGYPESALISLPFIGLVHEEDREMVMERYHARRSGEKVPDEYSFRIVTQAGEVREVNMRVGLLKGDDGRLFSIGSLQDVTEQRQTRQALAHSQADIASILNNMPDVFYRADMQGVITMMSPSCHEAIGYFPEEMIGRPMADFYCDPEDRERVVQALVEGGGKARHVEACMVHKDGSHIWVSTNAHTRVDSEGKPVCVEGIGRNISERKAMEEQLVRLAQYDELTQLLNRRQFMFEAKTQLDIALRYQHPLSVVMLDLDMFKSINDRFGHHVGDEALRYFADTCRRLFRKSDIIGRMGGEEFAILMPESRGEMALEMVERMRRHLEQQPLSVEDTQVGLSFSAGLATLSAEMDELDHLLRHADDLLYQAKQNGRNQVACDDG